MKQKPKNRKVTFRHKMHKAIGDRVPFRIKIELTENGKRFIARGRGFSLWEALGEAKDAMLSQVFKKKDKQVTMRKKKQAYKKVNPTIHPTPLRNHKPEPALQPSA